MEIEAMRSPLADGVKITLMVQVAPASRDIPQLFVSAKSLLLDPVIVMLVIFSAEVAEFVTVVDSAALGVPTASSSKVNCLGVNMTVNEPPIPPSGDLEGRSRMSGLFILRPLKGRKCIDRRGRESRHENEPKGPAEGP